MVRMKQMTAGVRRSLFNEIRRIVRLAIDLHARDSKYMRGSGAGTRFRGWRRRRRRRGDVAPMAPSVIGHVIKLAVQCSSPSEEAWIELSLWGVRCKVPSWARRLWASHSLVLVDIQAKMFE
jgi:hypothetical protein